MLTHSSIPANQWDQVKGEIQKTWNRLDAAELEGTHGDVHAISDLVQKRYGLRENDVDKKLDECIERCGTAAGPAMFRDSSSSISSGSASSAGSADLGSNVDPSSLSPSINQDRFSANRSTSPSFDRKSASDVSSQSFGAPEEGMDSAQSASESWNEGGDRVQQDFNMSKTDSSSDSFRDSRRAEDVLTNEPKRYGSSEGQVNDSKSETGRSGNTGRSETFEKSARNTEGSNFSRSNARNSGSNSAQNSRSSDDSSQEE